LGYEPVCRHPPEDTPYFLCMRFLCWFAEQQTNNDLCVAYSLMLDIATKHGWDAAQLVEETCNDFERKHLGAA
jgi:hypothetical protein